MTWPVFLIYVGLLAMSLSIRDATLQVLGLAAIAIGTALGFVREALWPWTDPPSISGKGAPAEAVGDNFSTATSTPVPMKQAP